MEFDTEPIRHYPPRLTLGMLLHYLGKLKTQIVWRFSRCGRRCNMPNNLHIYRL